MLCCSFFPDQWSSGGTPRDEGSNNLQRGSCVVLANQNEDSEVRELSGKEAELVPEHHFACKGYTVRTEIIAELILEGRVQ